MGYSDRTVPHVFIYTTLTSNKSKKKKLFFFTKNTPKRIFYVKNACSRKRSHILKGNNKHS